MSPAGYAAIWAALVLLLGATVGAARLELGALALPAALAIAGVKAALVMRYFMHLRGGPRVNAVYALAGFLWLAFLVGLTVVEQATR